LFRDNVWKLYELLKSVILDRGPWLVVELIRELSRILGIKMKLSRAFYSQMNRQTECINYDLEQYLRFFVDYRQKN